MRKALQQEEIDIKIENALRKLNTRDEESESNDGHDGNQKDDRDNEVSLVAPYTTTVKGVEYNTKERVVKEVVPPVNYIPSDEEVFKENDIPDYKFLLGHFKREGKLSESQMVRIIEGASSIMAKEQNLLHIDVPATIVGDIHGQYYDLIGMFELCGDPENTQYLFLGDYVDRGDRSIEVLILLYAMKINFPKRVWLLRGNHESERMTSYFTFKRECLQRYSEKVYASSVESFKVLPLCAILNEQFFCVHAGISSDLWDLKDIENIDRFKSDFPSSGLFCDLVWSDPTEDYDTEEVGEEDIDQYFSFNVERHCSEFYTYRAVESFLNHNDLLSVIRGHQPQSAGYRMYKTNDVTKFPSLITIFSAPNYCGTYDNMAAVLNYDGESFNIKQFDSYAAPYFLPDQMNLFEWSLPFVSEKVIEILSAVLNICTEEELTEEEILLTERNIEIIQQRKKDKSRGKPISDALHKKILLVGRLSRMLSLLREEREHIEEYRSSKLGSVGGYVGSTVGSAVGKATSLPGRVLIDGREALHRALGGGFSQIRALDLDNEGLPPGEAEQNEISEMRKKAFDSYILQDGKSDAEAGDNSREHGGPDIKDGSSNRDDDTAGGGMS